MLTAGVGERAPAFELAIAAIFRGESPYLREWIEFHRLVGVGHFFLYDDDGGAEAAALLRPYEEAGIATRHPWTHYDGTRHDGPTRFRGRNKNHIAFAHAARCYRERLAWLMKIDVDEFLVPLAGERTLLPALRAHDPRRVMALRIPRFNFGDCGHRQRPPGLVIESYTRREREPSQWKELGNARFLSANRRTNSAHRWGYRMLRRGRVLAPGQVSGMRVHHYYTKSLEEYLDRQNTSRGRVLTEERFRARNVLANEVEDGSLGRFLPELRRRLAAAEPAASQDGP